jgi:hypothetical protein
MYLIVFSRRRRMGKHRRTASGRWLLVSLVLAFAVGPAALGQVPRGEAETAALKKATANGKYTRLLTVIYVPGDKATYGEFNDYGPYNGTEWKQYKGLPTGNWVYVYPHWYIWEKVGAGGGGHIDFKKASVNGKYSNLLTVIHMPSDKGTYGEFSDYGPYTGTAWGTYKGLPKGNWVYVFPHWYIWGN